MFQDAESAFGEGNVLRATSGDEEYLQRLCAHSRGVPSEFPNKLAEKEKTQSPVLAPSFPR